MKLREITPVEYICSDCSSCPAVFETENGTYLIIGKQLTDSVLEQLHGRIGADEFVVEVPKGLLSGVKN